MVTDFDFEATSWAESATWFVLCLHFLPSYMILTWAPTATPPRPRHRSQSASEGMAARNLPGVHNSYPMSPAATFERNNVVKFDNGNLSDQPRSSIAEKFDSQQSGLHRRISLETRSEQEIQDLPRNANESLFGRLLSYKLKGDTKDDGKNIC